MGTGGAGGSSAGGSAGDGGGSAGDGGSAGASGVGGDGGAGGTSTGGSAGSTAGSGGDAGPEDAAEEFTGKDGAIPPPDSSGGDAGLGCGNDWLALGSQTLLAGGATPASFATAYNAEIDTITYGPVLIVLGGLTSFNNWSAQFGPLGQSEAGTSIDFIDSAQLTGMTLGSNGHVSVSLTEGSFNLIFATATTQATIPVVAVALEADLDTDCGGLVSTTLTMLIPTTAGATAFHGSTLSSLMGASNAVYGTQQPAWKVELSGTASGVNYVPPK